MGTINWSGEGSGLVHHEVNSPFYRVTSSLQPKQLPVGSREESEGKTVFVSFPLAKGGRVSGSAMASREGMAKSVNNHKDL